jgi:ubiquinone/menaquinone biosynthesis C-methylase UbiE
MTSGGKYAESYPIEHSERETQRLMAQARRLDLPMRRLLEDAGIAAGMRVLDIGSGAGDVALMAATFVGPTGAVVGVDMNPEILETARRLAREAGLSNVTLVAGDIREEFALDGEFDALVGRIVLAYLADPAPALRRLLKYLRSGGIVAIQDGQFLEVVPAYPPSPLWQRAMGWMMQAQARSGTQLSAGLRLYQTFLQVGLPTPEMRVGAEVLVGSDSPLIGAWAANLRALLPRIVELGIATEEEVNIDTFEERLRADFASPPKAAIPMLRVDAWARKP